MRFGIAQKPMDESRNNPFFLRTIRKIFSNFTRQSIVETSVTKRAFRNHYYMQMSFSVSHNQFNKSDLGKASLSGGDTVLYKL